MCSAIYTHVDMYILLNHLAVHLELTQHCKSTILQYKLKKKRNPIYLLSRPDMLWRIFHSGFLFYLLSLLIDRKSVV